MSIDFAILGVIGSRPSTGYDIKTEFEHTGQGLIWGISHGSIYTRLRELERMGWVTCVVDDTDGRQKKLYDLTPSGWNALMNWQEEPAEYPVVKDDLLLKVVYWANDENREALVEHLQVRKVRSKQLLGFFEQLPTNGESSVGEYGMLTIQYVVLKLKAELEWIELAIKQLQGPPQPPVQDPDDLVAKRRTRVQEAKRLLRNSGNATEGTE